MRKYFNRHLRRKATSPSSGVSRVESTGTGSSEASQDFTPEAFPQGIKELVRPSQSSVDIVFVHGLNGNREKTWQATGQKCPWPQTLLPNEFPTARILTFGYDASPAKARGVISKSRIAHHATNLLTSLASYRGLDATNERPVIFVCHSLGGLVCMDALVTSRQHPEQHLRNICHSTRGILFLGTPHHGSGLAMWAERLARHLEAVSDANHNILEVLRSDSEVLARIQDGFHALIRSQQNGNASAINISCFYEQIPTPHVGMIVNQDSATIPGFPRIGIHENHRDMTKFATPDHPGFIAICGELRRWILTSHASTGHMTDGCKEKFPPAITTCLAELHLLHDDIEAPSLPTLNTTPTLQKREPPSFDWFLESPEFKHWFEDGTPPILWCQQDNLDKPVLLGYLKDCIPRMLGYAEPHAIASIFCLQDHTEILLVACLVAQLIQNDGLPLPSKWADVNSRDPSLLNRLDHTLWRLLEDCVKRVPDRKVIILIDRIETLEMSIRNPLLNNLLAFQSRVQFDTAIRILVSSRDLSDVRNKLSPYPSVHIYKERQGVDTIARGIWGEFAHTRISEALDHLTDHRQAELQKSSAQDPLTMNEANLDRERLQGEARSTQQRLAFFDGTSDRASQAKVHVLKDISVGNNGSQVCGSTEGDVFKVINASGGHGSFQFFGSTSEAGLNQILRAQDQHRRGMEDRDRDRYQDGDKDGKGDGDRQSTLAYTTPGTSGASCL